MHWARASFMRDANALVPVTLFHLVETFRMTDQLQSHQAPESEDGDLSDMLEELRILLPGSQTLTAFLIILPFNNGFSEIRDEEKVVYIITFLCSLISLVLFTAPAAHHRLQRPLKNREQFKNQATKFMIVGLIPLSIALVLASQLVLSTVLGGRLWPWTITGILALIVLTMWWVFPQITRNHIGH
jgi:magnesium-transporting ATPase (P-type)